MAGRKAGWTVVILGLARMILRDRTQRRRVLARMLLLALGMMAAGLWLVDGWIEANPMRFLVWWGACAVVTSSVLLFAVFDALSVVREERERIFGSHQDGE
jgi:peptidoglycan biosynthesis protein MviN/MurJ (putative lipid II flippase)